METKNEVKVLRVGMKASLSRTITEHDVYTFAGLTGDYSRMHVDAEYAKDQRFGQRIAHGLIAASFPSTLMGMELPGSGTLMLDQTCEFKSPTFFGDTIKCEIEFTECVEKRNCYIAEFTGICTNQRGEVVISGKYHQMLSKDLFLVEE